MMVAQQCESTQNGKIYVIFYHNTKKIHYKICIQTFVAFIYADNELVERDIKKTIPFIIVI